MRLLVAYNDQDLWLAVALGSLPWIANALAAAFGYLCGSIPFGLILSWLGGEGDIRKIGSGNIGATNVLRTGRRSLALLTLILDCAKGFLPVFLANGYLGPEPMLWAGGTAFLGHLFPVWLRFAGGKGVAVYIGILLGLFWPAALFFCGVWLVVAIASRYSSLSALVAASLTPAFVYVMRGDERTLFLIVALSLMLFIRHRTNIVKLLAGDESKIRLGRSEQSTPAG